MIYSLREQQTDNLPSPWGLGVAVCWVHLWHVMCLVYAWLIIC